MRRNLRLDRRALALLGALLSFIIAWPGLVFSMPLMAMDNSMPDSSQSNSTYRPTSNNSTNNSNLFSNSYLQSDHSRSSLVPSAVSEHSVNQPANQSIKAEFNQSLSTHPEHQHQHQHQSQYQSPSLARAEDSDQLEDPLGFVISAAANDHLAVLSRTERSIRRQQQTPQKKHHHAQNHHHHQQQPQSPADNNFIGSKSKRLSNPRSNLSINSSSSNTPISNLDRNERSTVPQSHLAWTSRKIQLYIKNRILQIMRDGVVNGTQDENSEFTILQRSTVDVGRIKLQSVATCLYLCMDACGVPYGSKDFTDDCVFNENMGLQNYNTYSSTYHSQARRVFYLALNGSGQPRRTQIPASRSLGKLSTYTNAITETVPQERVEQLIAKNFGANRVKHGVRQLCDTGKPLIELIDVAKFRGPPHCSSNTSGSSTSKSSSTSSSSNSSTSSSSSRDVPVPAIGSLSSISNSSQSESGHISINPSRSSNVNSSSSSTSSSSSSPGGKKPNRRKKPRCKPHEQEETHNCQKRAGAGSGAGALRKLGPKAQRCKELREKAAAEKRAPPNCGKKNGARKSPELAKGVQQRAKVGILQQQQGGKRKPNKAGKQRQNGGKKQQQQQQQPAHQVKAVAGGKRKHRKSDASTTTTMATSLATPPGSHWESSSPIPALALSETSDRVERNVRMSSGEDQDLDQNQEQGDAEEEAEGDGASLEDASYEDSSSEAQGRSGAAGDDSLYYDFGLLSPRR
ncbi:ras guanine nucleotide exchange factor Y isoform X2 [Drosophila biarmipes]|uniref:ras guanine nucleotide exchange factor Y isoform X2 n=1 Tax=Drosophila biarmipes TaxID=125945 RepID=UPI0007E79035|nr:ras guanine nucleotide exchange factor Y isoform X2 [Drosophila biarmipes]